MDKNVENLELQEIAEIPVTENRNNLYAISVDEDGEAKVYPLSDLSTKDEVDKKVKPITQSVETLGKEGVKKTDITQDLGNDRSKLPSEFAVSKEVGLIYLELDDRPRKADVAIGMINKGTVNKVVDLPKTAAIGDAYFVKETGFMHQFDGKDWNQTVFSTPPSNVALKEDDNGDKVVYAPDGKVSLQNYDLANFGGGDWKSNTALAGADASYYCYEDYVIIDKVPDIAIRVKDNNTPLVITGSLLIAKVTPTSGSFSIEKVKEVNFSEKSNGRGELFLLSWAKYAEEYNGCHVFAKVNNRALQYNQVAPERNLYSLVSGSTTGNITKTWNILYAFITISEYNSLIPLQQTTEELTKYNSEYDRSLQELKNFEGSMLFTDNFSFNQGWKALGAYPLNDFSIANNLLKLDFTTNSHQFIEIANQDIEIGKEYNFDVTLRRLTNKGGSLDIGSTFGGNVGDGSTGWKTIPASDIASEFKTFSFSVKLTANIFIIGTHQSRNKGDSFEIQSFKVSNIESKMMREIIAIQAKIGMTSINDLQETITRNRVVQLPEGLIEISKTLIVPSNTRIVGVRGATKLKLIDDCTKIFDLGANSENIMFDNITTLGKATIVPTALTDVDIKNRTGAGADCGIYATGYAQNIHVRNCDFKDFSLAGINLYRTHKLYTRTFKITDCVFGESYFGLLSDTRSEYHTITGCTFAYNQMGAFIAGGNNFMGTCHFDANSVGLVLSGTSGENDSHGSIVGSSFNHNKSFSICAIDINNGFTFNGCHAFDGDILLDNAKGFVFVGGEIACRIRQQNINPSINVIHSTLFFKDSYGGGFITDKSKLSLMGNRFLDGSDSSSINN